jgi:hypothetical protein
MSIRLFLLLSLCFLAACSSKSNLPEANATVDLANGATISGTVSVTGDCPADQCVMASDNQGCHHGMVTEQHWIVKDGKVANAFVYIKDGLGNKIYPAPATPVVLDQRGCVYEPHVMGLVLGQKLEIRNSDPTLHNVKLVSATPGESFNRPFPQGTAPVDYEITSPGVMKKITCDVHSWMNSYVGVLTHPFFAVTDSNGHFEIKGIPPGEYTLEVWHESTNGAENAIVETQKITVAAKEAKTADFTIAAR